MKKFLAIILAAIMLLSLASCKKKTDGPSEDGEGKTAEVKTEEKKAAIAEFDFTQYGKGALPLSVQSIFRMRTGQIFCVFITIIQTRTSWV